MRISLRHLMLLVALAALVCAALVYGGIWTHLIWLGSVVVVGRMAIVAVVDRGPRQAFAIGFSLAAISYAMYLFACELNSTLSFWSPTEQLVQRAYRALSIVRVTEPRALGSGGMGMGGMGGGMRRTVPDYRAFRALGHSIFLVTLGAAAGWYARRVYRERIAATPPPVPSEPPPVQPDS